MLKSIISKGICLCNNGQTSALEYASDVWDPHYVGDTELEKVYNEEQPAGCWMIMVDLVR